MASTSDKTMTRMPKTLSYFLVKRKYPPSKERVKMALDDIKKILIREEDDWTRKQLAKAGLELNNILLRL
jgi:hypothetical protein